MTYMVVAGEESGDALAAELVRAIRREFALQPAHRTQNYQPLRASLEPRFFGAGGGHMKAAGVEMLLDLTQHSVIGLSDVVRKYFEFRSIMNRLCRAARDREPDVIICVDFSGFNRRFAHRIRQYTRRSDWFHDWRPKIVQYVSPQVWASRAGRAYQMAKDYDLLLSLFPFEKEWYAKRVPNFRVEFVGDPMAERYSGLGRQSDERTDKPTTLLMLPGSRTKELARHLPAMVGAYNLIRAQIRDLKGVMVLPSQGLVDQARTFGVGNIDLRMGGLENALAIADVAIASTGTVTRECAYMGVPTVAIYRTSWLTFQIGKQIVTVEHLAMPNLLANEEIFPEFIQAAASSENIAQAALELLQNPARRAEVKRKLVQVVKSLGGPGASERAAKAVLGLLS